MTKSGIANNLDTKYGANSWNTSARMPLVATSATQLWNDIVSERRVELAFEEHRYFDVRPWKIVDTVLNRKATGIRILKNADGTYAYTPGQFVEYQIFASQKEYWLPIRLDEMTKNPDLKQNPWY